MKPRRIEGYFFTILALVALVGTELASPAEGQDFTCLPTCDVADDKFLTIAGDGLVTLSDPVLNVSLIAEAGTTSFQIGVFDGDSGKVQPSTLESRWDLTEFDGMGVPIEVPFEYRLFASPPGGPEVQVDLSPSTAGCGPAVAAPGFVDSSDLLNDAWCDFTVPTTAAAQAPSGIFIYRLEVQTGALAAESANLFKIRTSGFVTIRLGEQPFSYLATFAGFSDFALVYPSFTPEPTTYDGEWSFFFDVSANQQDLIVWDGDFDRGRFDGDRDCVPQPACLVDFDLDTDDLDTPGAPFLPVDIFDVTGDACPEAIADPDPLVGPPGVCTPTAGSIGSTGNPPDDREVPDGVSTFAVRTPSVNYDVITPDGRVFSNDNPSGNQEWEQFLISTRPGCDPDPTCVPDPLPPVLGPEDPIGLPCADVCLPSGGPSQLPAGVYELRVHGVDQSNLNALRLPQLLCVDEQGVPCTLPASFSLGDTVFADSDGNGTQGIGEPGINGVIVNLLDEDGNLIGRTATATVENLDPIPAVAPGTYTFDTNEGTFSIQIAPENFAPAVAAGGTVGNRVWLDLDSGADQDVGEVGLTGVRVTLFEVGANGTADGGTGDDVFISSMLTGQDGVDPNDPSGSNYSFIDLPAGEYFAMVMESSLPDGLTATGGTGVGATRTIQADGTCLEVTCLDLDFGYSFTAGALGDRVWVDADADGIQGASEPGIGGVTLNLFDSTSALVATTKTGADGFYLFSGLVADTYTVEVDTSTLPAGLAATFDLDDGTVSPNDMADVALASGAINLLVDFGYDHPDPTMLYSIADVVWFDDDHSGALDAADGPTPGIGGVTVNLLAGGGVVASAVTAPDGSFSFANLPAGDYTLEISDHQSVLAGLLRTTPAAVRGALELVLGPDFSGVNFGYNDEGALSGAVGTTIKDPVGDTEEQIDTLVDLNIPDYDFGYQLPAIDGSLGDRVWNDVDGDGFQDPGEAGINDVTVWLFNSGGGLEGTAVTAGDGEYRFEGLAADTYTVVVDAMTLPVGFVQTFDLEGPLDHQAMAPLGSGQNRDDVDFGYADECLPNIDFETDGDGGVLSRGQRIDDEFTAFGITVTTHDPANHPAMIFDSSSPTGGDKDLGTPNQTFGGPGIGSGGEIGQPGANAEPLGNVLILSEDNDSSDPDDNAAGGTIVFGFAYPVNVDQVGILDIDEGMGGTVTAFDGAGAMIGSVAMAGNLGNNSVQTVQLGVNGVRRLEVFFPGSGAVSSIGFCVEEPECTAKQVRDDFSQPSFSNNDGPDDWSGDWIENDPKAGGAGPFAGQVQVHDGFLTLADYPNTGGEPSAAREVDLSGALNAKLTFKFLTTSSVDYDDAVTVEVSNDGGASWSTLEVITGITGAVTQLRTFDISAFISSETQVRFRVSNKYGGSGELFCITWIVIESSCTDPFTVRDEFNAVSYSNNDGPDDWESGWVEDDVAGAGPGSGRVMVYDQALTMNDRPNTGTQPSAAREVDLSGFTQATFSFDFWTTSGVDSSDAIKVEVSNDGGASFTVLETLTGIYGAVSGSRSYDISAFISADTRVRFRVANLYGGSHEYFFADNVQIEAQ